MDFRFTCNNRGYSYIENNIVLIIRFCLAISNICANFAVDKLCLTPNTTTMNEGFDYFRIKMAWNAEQEDGSLAKVKTEDLVYASSYTEAENCVCTD